MALTFRSLQSADEPLIRSWLATYLQHHREMWTEVTGVAPSGALSEVVEKEWLELYEDRAQAERLVCLACAPEPRGVVWARVRPNPLMGYLSGTIAWLYVDAASRRQGTAHALLLEAERWMVAQGAVVKEVFVTNANPSAVRAYEKAGFSHSDARMLGKLPHR